MPPPPPESSSLQPRKLILQPAGREVDDEGEGESELVPDIPSGVSNHLGQHAHVPRLAHTQYEPHYAGREGEATADAHGHAAGRVPGLEIVVGIIKHAEDVVLGAEDDEKCRIPVA